MATLLKKLTPNSLVKLGFCHIPVSHMRTHCKLQLQMIGPNQSFKVDEAFYCSMICIPL